jgi:chromosome partitioning protein
MPRKLSIINYKGGVGKTTLSAGIAGQLAQQGRKVLAVDLDPQASLTFSFIDYKDWKDKLSEKKTIKQFFEFSRRDNPQGIETLVFFPDRVKKEVQNKGGRLDVLASHLDLIDVEIELARDYSDNEPHKYFKVLRHLSEAINKAGAIYDDIVIDCPPSFSLVTRNGIVASDFILIPAKPDHLSTTGIAYLVDRINTLVKRYNENTMKDQYISVMKINPQIVGLVFTMVSIQNGQPEQTVKQFMSASDYTPLGIDVFKKYIKWNPRLFADNSETHIPVTIIRSNVPVQQEIIANFRDIVDELCLRMDRKI